MTDQTSGFDPDDDLRGSDVPSQPYEVSSTLPPTEEPWPADAYSDLYDEERESVSDRIDRYADLVFDDDEPAEPVERRDHHVVAVMVAHDGLRWLPPATATIDRLDRAPDQMVAVDTGSLDGSDALLSQWLGEGSVVRLEPTSSFGAAVAAGVAHADRLAVEGRHGRPGHEGDDDVFGYGDDEGEGQGAMGPGPGQVAWVWILHDDCAPDPQALQALLDASDGAVTAGIVGPKVLGWHDRRLLLETGLSIAGSGRRISGLERGEHDQGQHDGIRDVLAVGSAGMLVRRDVWDLLGGFDPSLSMFRDDIDLGWRANEAGYRVIVATDAVVHHAEAAIHGRRPLAAVDADAGRADREAAMHVLLAHSSAVTIPLQLVRLIVGSLARGVGLLLAKAPDEASDEFGAVGVLLVHPGRVMASRRLVAQTRELTQRDLRGLRPRIGGQIRHAGEALLGVVGGSAGTTVTRSGATASGPSDDDAFDTSFEDSRGRLGFWLRRPALLLAVLLTLVSLVSVRAWFAFGLLEGGALLPAPSGVGDLWSTYAEGWHEVGPGAATAAPPYLMVVGAVAAFLLGSASRAVDAIMMVGVPIAGVVAYLALRRVVGSRLVRTIAAAAYALLPAAIGAVATGRIGTVVFLILLPALIRVALRSAVSWRAVWGGALLLAVMTAFVPLSWVIAVVLVLVALLGASALPALAADGVVLPGEVEAGVGDDGRPGRRHVFDPASGGADTALIPFDFRAGAVRLRLLALVLVPLALLLPWSVDLLRHPSSWLLQAGLPGPTSPDLVPWQVSLMSPGGPGTVPVWFTAGIVALALGGLVRRVSRPIATLAWGFALVGLAVAVLQTLVEVRPPSEPLALPSWPGPATIVLGLGLIVAAAAAADGIGVRLAVDSFSWRQPAAVIALVAAVAAPIMTGGWWVWKGVGDTVVRGDGSAVPAFVAAESLGPERPRSLVFRPSARGIEYAVIDGEGPRLGAAETGPPASAYEELDALVGDLMAGRGGGEIDGLGRYGVRFVVLTAPSPTLVSVLDSEPGLRRISSAEGDTLWRLDTDSARARALAADPRVTLLAAGIRDGAVAIDGPLPAGMAPRSSLVLAERSDPSWRATLDGVALAAVADDGAVGWRQRFTLPAAQGTLRLWFDQEPRHRWLWLQGLLVSLVVVLALPGRRRPTDDPDADVAGDDSFIPSVPGLGGPTGRGPEMSQGDLGPPSSAGASS